MAVLGQLEPRRVFHYFEELCAIPHGSGNTGALSDWCVDFARARGLEHYQDNAGNVIIIREASSGYEAAEPVIVQGHLDMVCEKEPGCSKDMAREGLDLAVEGDSVYAKGTTLGGDDGIAVAMGLALLEDEELPHPRLEVVLTTGEEVGMTGAAVLDLSPLQGTRLLNLDSEEEGIFTVSCAGGSMVRCTLPLTRAPFDGAALAVAARARRRRHCCWRTRRSTPGNMSRASRSMARSGWAHPSRRTTGLAVNGAPSTPTFTSRITWSWWMRPCSPLWT